MYMPAQIQRKTVKMVEIEPESDVPRRHRRRDGEGLVKRPARVCRHRGAAMCSGTSPRPRTDPKRKPSHAVSAACPTGRSRRRGSKGKVPTTAHTSGGWPGCPGWADWAEMAAGGGRGGQQQPGRDPDAGMCPAQRPACQHRPRAPEREREKRGRVFKCAVKRTEANCRPHLFAKTRSLSR